MQRSIAPSIAALLAILATVALVPQCSRAASCCRTGNTAALIHRCCIPTLNRAVTTTAQAVLSPAIQTRSMTHTANLNSSETEPVAVRFVIPSHPMRSLPLRI